MSDYIGESALYVSREKTDLEVGLDKTSGMAAIASSRDSFAFESSFSPAVALAEEDSPPSSSRPRESPAKGSVSTYRFDSALQVCYAESKGL